MSLGLTRHRAASSTLLIAAALLLHPSSARSQTATPQFERAWGSTGTAPGQFRFASGIACDAAGNVYVTDAGGGVGSIHKFDNDGVFMATWTMAGSEVMGYLADAAVSPDGHLFAIEDGSRIHKFTLAGTHVSSFGTCCGGLPERLSSPLGIDVDQDGFVYVADTGNHRIAVFDGSGAYVSSWDGAGTGIGLLAQVMAIACDDQGSVFVQDLDSFSQVARMKSYSTAGSFLAFWGGAPPDAPLALGSVDHGSAGFVVSAWRDQKLHMTNVGGVPLVPDFGGHGDEPGQFEEISGIAIDLEGNIFVSDGRLNRVTKFSAVAVPASSATWGRIKHQYR